MPDQGGTPGGVPSTESVGAAPKRCPGCGGRAGASLAWGWWSVGLDRRSPLTQLAYKDLTRRRDTEARLCLFCGVPSGSWDYLPLGSGLRPEVEPRELSADHLQLVLRAGFVEPVDQRD